MVSNVSIVFLAVSLVLSIGVPAAVTIYCRKKYKISFLNIFVGAGVFVLFVMVLESSMHMYLLKTNFNTSNFLDSSPWIFATYGALAAGVFEEMGRFLGYKFLLKGRIERKDGIAYGIGHGGIEAILLGGFTIIQSLYFSVLINSGSLSSTLGGKLSSSMLNEISNSLINTAPHLFLATGIERVLAFTIQIGLSLVVLQAVKSKKYRYLFYAVLLHALVDFPAALYQKGMITNVWIVELFCVVLAVCSFIFIKNWDKIFKNKNMGDID